MQKESAPRASTPNERLRYERQLRGWSQGHLARQIDAPDYYISRWERGEVLPSPYYQQKLCELFGKTAEELGMLPARDDTPPPQPQKRKANNATRSTGPITPIPEFSIESASLQIEPPSPPEPPASPRRDETPAPPGDQKSFFLPHIIGIPFLKTGRKTERRRWYHTFSIVLGVVVIVSLAAGLLSRFVLNKTSSQSTLSPAIVGHLYFLSSGQTTDTSNQGIADEVDLTIQHMPAPAPGKSYYAWLLPDIAQPEGTEVPLGKLDVREGRTHLVYNGNQHMNLLAITSRILVTEEDATVSPLASSVDESTWRYIGVIPQVRVSESEGLQLSFLDHLRHLLAYDPDLNERGLLGGVTIWLYRNTEQVLQWSMDARNDWRGNSTDVNAVRQQAIRILEYLDGVANVQTDAPLDKALPILVDRRQGSIGLLQLTPQQQPFGHLYHVNIHLLGMRASPDSSPAFREHASGIIAAINHVNAWLEQVRRDARQLVAMTDDQLRQPSALAVINDMETNANAAFVGRSSPTGGNNGEGVVWIRQNVQSLATIDITAYKPPSNS